MNNPLDAAATLPDSTVDTLERAGSLENQAAAPIALPAENNAASAEPRPSRLKPWQNPHGRKNSKAEVDKRRALVESLMLEGASHKDIVQITKSRHNISERQVTEDMSVIRARWKEESNQNLEELRGRTLARLMQDRRELKREKAWTAFMTCERLICDVARLRGPDNQVNVQVNSQGNTQINVLSPEDQEHEARALLAAIERDRRQRQENGDPGIGGTAARLELKGEGGGG